MTLHEPGAARGDLPDPHGLVLTGRSQVLAVVGERQSGDPVCVTEEGWSDLVTGPGIPQRHRMARALGRERLAVRAERHPPGGLQDESRSPAGDIQDPHAWARSKI